MRDIEEIRRERRKILKQVDKAFDNKCTPCKFVPRGRRDRKNSVCMICPVYPVFPKSGRRLEELMEEERDWRERRRMEDD